MATDKTNIILCGSVEKSSSAPEKMWEWFPWYMFPQMEQRSRRNLDHYPSIEISKEDLEDN